MCGIAGYITKKQNQSFSFNLASKNLKKLMKNRGPDQQGSFYHSTNNYMISLFSSRLSIIDREQRSNQPLKTDNSVIVFNGEIYNFVELRKKLEEKKIKFLTNSDTEVLLRAYEFWGEKCVKYFDGMWSFCIYDHKNKKVFLSRDNFGEKPLYYFFDTNNLIFGSEIKYIHYLSGNDFIKKIDFNKVNDYLYRGYKSINKNNTTFFEKIIQLDQGTNISIDLKNFKILKQNYLDRKMLPKKEISKDINENIFDIKELVENSMKLRLRSDVPVAFCLSGGIDSASLVSICCKKFNVKPNCFSIIDSDERYNEKENIKIIQKDTGCTVNYIHLKKEGKEKFINNIQEQIRYHDAPISTISYYIHSKISKAANASGYKVIFSGTGADEIFTGYYDHFLMHLNEIKNKQKYKMELNSWINFIKPLTRNKNLQNPYLFSRNKNFRDHIYNDEIVAKFFYKKNKKKFTEELYNHNLMKNRMLNELFHESVPVILKEDDLNSMYYSVENRSPFLSKDLVSYALSIKNENYIQNSYSKNILRLAMKNILHDKIRLNRQKKGFNSNLKSITYFDNFSLYNFLNESKYLQDIIDLKKIKKINFENQISNSLSKFLFSLINLKIFLEINNQ